VTRSGESKNWGSGFGIALAARVFGHSPRHIRTLLKGK
jgi:hypothetical protein